mgnify:CR=1 FL=1
MDRLVYIYSCFAVIDVLTILPVFSTAVSMATNCASQQSGEGSTDSDSSDVGQSKY